MPLSTLPMKKWLVTCDDYEEEEFAEKKHCIGEPFISGNSLANMLSPDTISVG